MRNSSVPLRVDGKVLNVIGVDDPVNERSDLRSALKGVDLDYPSILLAHSPTIFEEASASGIDFLLAGHTHGGQIFTTKILRKLFPLDPALEFLEGFFQKGKMLMYVSRGIGTSYLPFRLGVKPEITFFTFANDTNDEKIRMAQTDKVSQSNSPRDVPSRFQWDPINQINPKRSLLISNNPPKTVFTGLRFSDVIETFNIFSIFDSLGLTTTQPHRNKETLHHSVTAAQKVLFDFESESDLKKLNWECHKWFELSEENATSGKQSLKVTLPPGQYPGVDFEDIKKDWSNSNSLEMDVFNPSDEILKFHIRIDDNESRWEYANRFDVKFSLGQGMNHLSIPVDSIRTNIHDRPLNLKKIKRTMVFVPNNPEQREFYIDNIRLE